MARIDVAVGEVRNLTRGTSLTTRPLPPLLAEIVIAGGLVAMLAKEGWIEPTPRLAATS
jgi:hypothetical protein